MATPRDIRTEALVVSTPGGGFEMQPIILDEVRSDEVLVEMKYSGICHTDILFQTAKIPNVEYPAIFGHEGAGVIRALGSHVKDTSLRVGDSVLLSFNSCGQCKQCLTGSPSYCHIHFPINAGLIRVSDGSTPARFAESGTPVRSQCFGQSSFSRLSIVTEKSVIKCPYPDSLSYYAPLGCGFQTGAGTVLNVLKPDETNSVVIFGIGSVGIAALMAAAYLQVKQLVAVDMVDEKLALAKEFGATVINPTKMGDEAIGAVVKRLTEGGVDYAIDCTGRIPVIESLFTCLGPKGTAVSVGVPPPNSEIRINPQTFLMENTSYIGVLEGGSNPQKFIPQLMELHQQGHFPVEKLCKVYSVKDFDTAISDLREGKVIKPVIHWD